jgi:hypothetical protein
MLPTNFKRRATKAAVPFPNTTVTAQAQQIRTLHYQARHGQGQGQVSRNPNPLPSTSEAVVRQSSTLLPVGRPSAQAPHNSFGVSNPIPSLSASRGSSSASLS